ncbi:hypothetical protein [Nitrincola sp. MINF-07-Sa-05]
MWKRFKGQLAEQDTISFQGYRLHYRDCSLKHLPAVRKPAGWPPCQLYTG